MVLEDDVCGTCNTEVFSPLDGILAEFVRQIAFADHPDVPNRSSIINGLLLNLFNEETQLWETVRVDRKGMAIALQQFIFASDTNVRFKAVADGRSDDVLASMRNELASPGSLEVAVEIIPDATPPWTPSLVRSAPGKYVIRAPDDAAAARLRVALDAGKLGSFTATGGGTATQRLD